MTQNARKPRPKADPVDPTEAAEPPGDYQSEAPATRTSTDDDATDYVVDSNGEVRAGPGDAGAQDKPRVLDQPARKPPSWSRGLMIGGILGVLILILIYFLAL